MDSNEQYELLRNWKKNYLEKLVDELKPQGSVLQVGFGLGDASNRIQTFKPKHHIIIEKDPELFKQAKNWAQKMTNVTLLEGNWEKILPDLGVFDSLIFDEDSARNLLTAPILTIDMDKSSSEAQKVVEKLENEIAQLHIQYTDEQIDQFFKQKGQYQKEDLPGFFKKLKERRFITETQYKKIFQKYHLETNPTHKKAPLVFSSEFAFLKACLKSHMHKGSRFTCFCIDNTSKYEDAAFFEHIINDPDVDFFEKTVQIDIPQFSKDFKFADALVIIVEKFS